MALNWGSASRHLFRLVLFIGAAAGPAAGAADAQRRAMTVEDFLSVRVLGDPQLSPDGQFVAFTVSEASLETDRNVSRIWIVPAGGGDAQRLTSDEGSDRAPLWAPDGESIGFISTRGGSPQVWRVPRSGGEPTRLTTLPTGVNDFRWSSDGRDLYLVSDIKWPGTQEIDRREGAYPTSARIWTSLFYRHWNEWRAGIRTHLFRMPLAGGRAVDLTPIDSDVPTLALSGRSIGQSALGTEIAIVYNPDAGAATSTNNDIFVMGADGTARQPITTSPANDHSPPTRRTDDTSRTSPRAFPASSPIGSRSCSTSARPGAARRWRMTGI